MTDRVVRGEEQPSSIFAEGCKTQEEEEDHQNWEEVDHHDREEDHQSHQTWGWKGEDREDHDQVEEAHLAFAPSQLLFSSCLITALNLL